MVQYSTGFRSYRRSGGGWGEDLGGELRRPRNDWHAHRKQRDWNYELWQTLATAVNNTANSRTLSMERQLL